MKEKIVKIIICSLFVIWLFVVFVLSPLGVVVGILNGDLDLETLEPKAYEYESVEEQIRSDRIIQ